MAFLEWPIYGPVLLRINGLLTFLINPCLGLGFGVKSQVGVFMGAFFTIYFFENIPHFIKFGPVRGVADVHSLDFIPLVHSISHLVLHSPRTIKFLS